MFYKKLVISYKRRGSLIVKTQKAEKISVSDFKEENEIADSESVDIFSIQLKSNAKKGDVLIVYSGSGNSQNILNAVNLAKQIGMTVIGFTGRDGGKLKDLCDIIVIAPTYSMEQIEDLHLLYAHAISDCIQKKLGCKLC